MAKGAAEYPFAAECVMQAAIHDFATFASEAELLLLYAMFCFASAGVAAIAERKRAKRKTADAVGFMPWMGIFFASAFIGAGLFVMGVKGVLAG